MIVNILRIDWTCEAGRVGFNVSLFNGSWEFYVELVNIEPWLLL